MHAPRGNQLRLTRSACSNKVIYLSIYTCKIFMFFFTLAEDTRFRTRVERRHALYDLPTTKIMKDKR